MTEAFENMFLPELTVVVTTFRRPARLRKCLQSLVDAGVENVVVASSGGIDEEIKICDEFPTLNVTTSLSAMDDGCNECWLRGVTLAPTKYVLILHDDDWLLPEFGKAYAEEIYPHLWSGRVGFATWRGKVVSDIGEVDDDVGCLRGETRVCGTANVTKATMDLNVTSPSPVISIFRRDVSVRALREAEHVFTDRQHFTRPKMMVGNDLLLYLRHAEAFDSWLFIDKILTGYGGHDGSETARHREPKKLKYLLSIYNAARKYFSTTRRQPLISKFFHVWTDYLPQDEDARRRQLFARVSWHEMYRYGEAYAVPYPDGAGRTSKEVVGDVRPLPFMRDMLDYAARLALDEDVIMLSNDDIAFTPEALAKLRHQFDSGANALFSWRHNFTYPLTHPIKDLRTGHKDGGVDLVAFRPTVWRQYRERFPDFILGCEAWDYCYRTLIPELPGGREIDGIIYHEYHDPIWRQSAVRTSNPGQRYNRHLARNFFRRRGESDENIPKFEDNV